MKRRAMNGVPWGVENRPRNAAMYDAHQAGASFRAVGDAHQISPSRAREIIKRETRRRELQSLSPGDLEKLRPSPDEIATLRAGVDAAEAYRIDRRLSLYWRGRGLSVRASNLLSRACCGTDEDVKALGPEGLARIPGCGQVSIREILTLIGDSP